MAYLRIPKGSRRRQRSTLEGTVEVPYRYLQKLAIPCLRGTFPRERLFLRIDTSLNHPGIWITGAPGAGKTTLAADYLKVRGRPSIWYQVDEGDSDIASFFHYFRVAAERFLRDSRGSLPVFRPEYIPEISVFARHFFRGLFNRSTLPLMIVLDDCHEVDPSAHFYEVLKTGVEEAPDGINFLFMSRHVPPPAMHRLLMNGSLLEIEPAELRLDNEEAIGFAEARLKNQPDRDYVLRMHDYTDGWAAGMVLMLDSGVNRDLNNLTETTRNTLFNYFAGEIFDRMSEDDREFLMKTAVLSSIATETARELTGCSDAGAILARLKQQNHFVELYAGQEAVYRYHPLFRSFLLDRAEGVYTRAQINMLRAKAAELLKKRGAIEIAFKLYIESGEWRSAGSVIMEHALKMLNQGRYMELESWLKMLPPEIIETSPWLLFYRGVCLLYHDPSRGLDYFKKAFNLFPATNIIGRFAAWSGAVDSILYTWDDFKQLDYWIDQMDRMRRAYHLLPVSRLKYSVAASMFGALIYRRPYHRELGKWMRRAITAARSSPQLTQRMLINYQLVTYFVWNGEFNRARVIMNELRDEAAHKESLPIVRIASKLVTALYYWLAEADYDGCREAVSEGLKLAEESGLHIWDNQLLCQGIAGALTGNDLDSASEYLERLGASISPDHRLERSFYHFLSGWHALQSGNLSLAREHTEIKIAEELGAILPEALQLQSMAVILTEEGRHDLAEEYLRRAKELGRGRTATVTSFFRHLLLVRIHRMCHRRAEMLKELREAMSIGRQYGLWTTPLWHPSDMAELCKEALKEGIERDYVRELIRRRNLVPEAPPVELEEWPWPLKVFTLGRFEILIDDRPLHFSGKAQQKPLELLKAILSFGGQDVAQERLTDVLWPDAEGDNAQRSLITNIHRLRKLIGYEKAIRFQNRRLTLDPHYWWVDVWKVERLMKKLEETVKLGHGGVDKISSLIEEALSLYKGEFLAGETFPSSLLSLRERLRKKFIYMHELAGTFYEDMGEWKMAVQIYFNALEVDDLSEEFYQRLMICYRNQGRLADARAVYERCRTVLEGVLGITPSEKTVEIFRSLTRQGR